MPHWHYPKCFRCGHTTQIYCRSRIYRDGTDAWCDYEDSETMAVECEDCHTVDWCQWCGFSPQEEWVTYPVDEEGHRPSPDKVCTPCARTTQEPHPLDLALSDVWLRCADTVQKVS